MFNFMMFPLEGTAQYFGDERGGRVGNNAFRGESRTGAGDCASAAIQALSAGSSKIQPAVIYGALMLGGA
ncbi:hypothetical protein [Lacisediminimonas sp.]|uniref:hypothetical protein n=1 Tax=Lacisediminimonas sp. TaxID=3060582 RepID=UPI00272C26B7|nr:hypothetical protein [Lacisediminimonas sp.]